MTELTEAEIERLVWEFGDHTNIYTLVDTVAAILAARLAPIRALADEWERAGFEIEPDQLRAALNPEETR